MGIVEEKILKYILNRLMKWANPKGIAISTVAFIVSIITINGDLIGVEAMKKVSGGVGVLDLEPTYSVEKAYEMLDMMGEVGRQFYLFRIIPQDFIFPLAYGIAFSLIILYLIHKIMPKNEPALGIAYIPLTAMIFDFLENICVINILIQYPKQLAGVVQISNLFTVIKSSLLGFTILTIILCVFILLVKHGAGKVGIGRSIDD